MDVENKIFELAAKKFSGEISSDEDILLSKLLTESNENQEIFDELQLMWQKSKKTMPDFSANTDKALDIVNSNIILKKKFSIAKLTRIAAAAIILIFLSIYLFYLNTGTTYIKADNSKIEYTLSDGTKVWLNKFSHISFNKNFNKKLREVTISGEAYFIVSHDSLKPFVIVARNTQTQVLGTEFNIYNKNDEVKVDLTKGKVKFTEVNSGEFLYLSDKQSVRCDINTGEFTKDNVYNVNNNSWVTGILKFENTELQQIANDLSAYYNIEIRVENSIQNARFSSTIEFKNEKLENILKILSLTLNIEVQKYETFIVLRAQNEEN